MSLAQALESGVLESMAAGRKCKVGLDYFELDCITEEPVRLIRAEYGIKAFAVIVMLWQKIYSSYGYYCEWNEDVLLLFMSDNGISGDSKNLIKDIVSACFRRDIFSKKLFELFGILTSVEVQEMYIKATAKREKVELVKEYLLISDGINRENIVINSISSGKNPNVSVRNKQSKVEKSREENKNTVHIADACALFEELWKLYPVKKGKGKVSQAAKLRLLEVGKDEMVRAVRRYTDYVEGIDYLHYQNGSTFFTSGYIDYLDANYKPDRKKGGKQGNGFGNIMRQDYDFEQLEKEILSN